MSASSEDDYLSAEERDLETAGEGDAVYTENLSRGLERASLSEREDGSSVDPPVSEVSDTAPGVDNASENVKEKTPELTEEEIVERKEQAGRLKTEGNDTFKRGEYTAAVKCYTDAIELYPSSNCAHEVAACYANRAACHLKLEEYQKVVDDCTKALELKEVYLKAHMRRAQANEALEKYEDALEDYKKALELDPSQVTARRALMYLPEKIKEQQEKLKAEMLGKLKELGNAVLNPFGLSTDNFQFQQDPKTGGYSVNFKR